MRSCDEATATRRASQRMSNSWQMLRADATLPLAPSHLRSPQFERNGVGPSSSSPITKPWLDSIDAVYKLFEDANLRAQYPTLAPKVQSAVQLCEEVIRELGLEKCALSFNGVKDCEFRSSSSMTPVMVAADQLILSSSSPGTVVVHILAAVLRRLQGSTSSSQLVSIPSVYITCPSPFPVLETFIRDSQTRYNLSLATVPGGMKEGLVEYFEGGGRAGVVPDLQTNGQEKSPNRPVERNRDVKAIFIGTRRTDPGGDTLDPRKWTDPSWPQVERIHPILDWDYADVWAFLRCPALGCSQIPGVQGEAEEPGVPYCTLYDEGYTSLGSTFNTFPNPTLKVESVGSKESFRPAWQLQDASSERDGRGDQKK